MAEQTKIQWAHHSFNPWRGCNPKVLGIWGSEASGATRVVAAEDQWKLPRKWNKEARRQYGEACHAWELHERHRVFCASLADVFEDWQGPMVDSHGDIVMRYPHDENVGWSPESPEAFCEHGKLRSDWRHPDPQGYVALAMQDVRARLFRTIDATLNLDWLLLTKRPENVRRMWPETSWGQSEHTEFIDGLISDVEFDAQSAARSNVWLGVSCSTQEDCDRLIPELLKCRGLAAKLFVSLEPLVEPVGISRQVRDGVDWVIVGGESGPNARPYHIDWARAVIQQCKDTGVACFHKQLGSNCVYQQCSHDHKEGIVVGFGIRDPKGGDMGEWPEDLRVREVPSD